MKTLNLISIPFLFLLLVIMHMHLLLLLSFYFSISKKLFKVHIKNERTYFCFSKKKKWTNLFSDSGNFPKFTFLSCNIIKSVTHFFSFIWPGYTFKIMVFVPFFWEGYRRFVGLFSLQCNLLFTLGMLIKESIIWWNDVNFSCISQFQEVNLSW